MRIKFKMQQSNKFQIQYFGMVLIESFSIKRFIMYSLVLGNYMKKTSLDFLF